jgi:hypothetical protein
MAKRAYPLAKTKLEATTVPQNGHTEHQPVSARPPGEASTALPEAPASANVHVTLAGRTVQVTLRDSDEQRLLARLEALLQRFPVDTSGAGLRHASDARVCLARRHEGEHQGQGHLVLPGQNGRWLLLQVTPS